MKRATVIYGLGQFAHIIGDAILSNPGFAPVAYTADAQFCKVDTFRGLAVVPFEDLPRSFPPETTTILIALGFARMRTRKEVFERVVARGYRLEQHLDHQAVVGAGVTVGRNSIIDASTYIGPGAVIGDHVHVRPQTYIGHDCRIGDHCYIAPGVKLGGGCVVGSASFVGIGTTVVDSVVLGDETFVGAGSLVLRDTEPSASYFGNPARLASRHPDTGVLVRPAERRNG